MKQRDDQVAADGGEWVDAEEQDEDGGHQRPAAHAGESDHEADDDAGDHEPDVEVEPPEDLDGRIHGGSRLSATERGRARWDFPDKVTRESVAQEIQHPCAFGVCHRRRTPGADLRSRPQVLPTLVAHKGSPPTRQSSRTWGNVLVPDPPVQDRASRRATRWQ